MRLGEKHRHGLYAFFFLSFSLVLIWIGQWGILSIPPLMPKIFPFAGWWRQEFHQYDDMDIFNSPLDKTVTVTYDAEGIPHIFSETDKDLYWVQGYLSARDRLWQMDFQTRVAEGSVSELLGQRTQFLDEYFVKIGMRQAIELATKEILTDPITRVPALQFVEGVNAYIQSLDSDQLPLEYFLTRTRPRLWTARQIAALLKLMTFRLAGYSDDLRLTHYLQKFGNQVVEDLFPERKGVEVPFAKIPLSANRPVSLNLHPEKIFVTALKDFPDNLQPFPGNGSNNWAVSGMKTKSGFSLLSNDTHLSYSLPSIWYEMQLSTPRGSVYGATIPGAPGIILGYNDNIAWGTTNGSTDVMDWYEIEFRDEKSDEYLVDGSWRQPDHIFFEEIYLKGKGTITQKVIWTYLGPVVYREGKLGLAMKWAAHEPSNELKALLRVNRAQDYSQCFEYLQDFKAPIQNFICADAHNVGIRHNGRIPRRFPQQGRYIQDGRYSRNDWQGWFSPEETPEEINPSQGFVHSANQRPTMISQNGVYLGWNYPEAFRGQRIRDFLSSKAQLDDKDMIALQNDTLNEHAQLALPLLLELTEKDTGRAPSQDAHALIQILGSDLSQKILTWDYRDQADSLVSALFANWWNHMEQLLWEDDFGPPEKGFYPSRDRTLLILKHLAGQPDHQDQKWVDNLKTPEHETLPQVVREALRKAREDLNSHFGDKIQEWQWFRLHPTRIRHVSYIPGLGLNEIGEGMRMGGSQYSVNSNKGQHGPTWRMVVAFNPQPQGWGNYPGGTSGDPLSIDYTRFVNSWSQGKLRPFRYYRHQKDGISEARHTLHFYPVEKN